MLEKVTETSVWLEKKIVPLKNIRNDIVLLIGKNIQDRVQQYDILLLIENSSQLKNKNFSRKPEYSASNIIFYTIDTQGNEKKEIFNLETQKFIENLEPEKQKISEKLEKWKYLIYAMNNIFENNSKENFRELNNKDVLTSEQIQYYKEKWWDFSWRNLRDLQKIFRENFWELEQIKTEMNPNQEKIFIAQQKKYLEMIMGVGDFYEGGAVYLLETQKNFEKIAENIIQHGKLTDVFVYMARLHQEIDKNNFQSESVENSYKILMNTLSEKLFHRLKTEKASDEHFINFSKLLTGRKMNSIEGNGDIDDTLRNPILATQALYEVFTREGGAFEKMNIKNLDEKLHWKTVNDVLSRLEKIIHIRYADQNSKRLYNELVWGYEKIINAPNEKYEVLDFQTQAHLSYLNNLAEHLEKIQTSVNSFEKWYSSSPLLSEMNIYLQRDKPLADVANEIAMKSFEENAQKVEEIFVDKDTWFNEAKTAEDFGLTGVYKDAYELFADMNGVWMLEWWDQTVERWKTIGKFGGMVVAMLAVAPFTAGMSLPTAGAVFGATGSATGLVLNPRWFDTIEQAASEIGSDFVINSLTGAWGAYAIGKVSRIPKVTNKWWSALLAWAETGVGMLTEVWRIYGMSEYYPIQSSIIDADWSEIEKIYQQQ